MKKRHIEFVHPIHDYFSIIVFVVLQKTLVYKFVQIHDIIYCNLRYIKTARRVEVIEKTSTTRDRNMKSSSNFFPNSETKKNPVK